LEIEKTTLLFSFSLLVNANQALGFMFSTLSSGPGVLGVLLQVRTLFFSQILIESNFNNQKFAFDFAKFESCVQLFSLIIFAYAFQSFEGP
jgi:hypothetical protein